MYGKSPAKAGIYPLSFPAKLHKEEGELGPRRNEFFVGRKRGRPGRAPADERSAVDRHDGTGSGVSGISRIAGVDFDDHDVHGVTADL